MKFGDKLLVPAVPEWKEFYLEYNFLKKIISPYKVMGKFDEDYLKAKTDLDQASVCNYTSEDLEKLNTFSILFEEVIFSELSKIYSFYHIKMKDLVSRWRELKMNGILVRKSKDKGNYEERKEQLKILKKHKKFSKKFIPNNDLKSKFDSHLRDRDFYYHKDALTNLISAIEAEYLDLFYNRGDRKVGSAELRKIAQGRLISQNESFFFGFFFGLCFSLIMLMWVMSWQGNLSQDDDMLFQEVFPIFRGMGIIVAFIWLLGWNVYGWTHNNINYKLIFQFQYHHYSTISEILTRAAFFTSVLLVMFLWYIILRQEIDILSDIFGFIDKDYCPIIVWIIFVGYMIFPSETAFNGQGRIYTFKLLKDILMSPCVSSGFRVLWATDQLASFVTPLKDFEYTVCYYTSKTVEQQLACQSPQRFTSAVFMASIPFVLRTFQNWRILYDEGTFKNPAFYNSIKYITSLLVVFFSYTYATTAQPGYFYCWIISAVISTAYSYFWDLKMDWGFLQENTRNKFLRNELSYSKTFYYFGNTLMNLFYFILEYPAHNKFWHQRENFHLYIILFLIFGQIFIIPSYIDFVKCSPFFSKHIFFSTFSIAIALNLVFRLAWVLSISPDLIDRMVRPELLTFIIGFVEIFRRSIWNFLRVEKEHLSNVGTFKSVNTYQLPFDKIELNIDETQLFKHDLISLLEKNNSNDEEIDYTFTPTKQRDNYNLNTPLLQNSQKPKQPTLKRVSSFLTLDINQARSFIIQESKRQQIMSAITNYKESIVVKARYFKVEQQQTSDYNLKASSVRLGQSNNDLSDLESLQQQQENLRFKDL